jgi:hypothetical protein
MKHVPANILIVVPIDRRVDGEREVSTALGGTVVAEHCTRCEILAA